MATRAWAAIAAVLLLSGCATTVAPEPGLTADQLDAARVAQADALWASTGLYPTQRPANPRVITVSADDWAPAFVKCMNIAGFDNYTAEASGYSVTSDGQKASEFERLSRYLCEMTFEVDGQWELEYNPAQIEYLYDYYATVLEPCLAAHGYKADSVPTRGEFEAQLGTWHPYFAMHAEEWVDLFEHPQMLVECPPSPPGFDDQGLSAYFGR